MHYVNVTSDKKIHQLSFGKVHLFYTYVNDFIFIGTPEVGRSQVVTAGGQTSIDVFKDHLLTADKAGDVRTEIKVPAHNDILRGVPTVHGQGEVIHDFDLFYRSVMHHYPAGLES